MSNPVVLITGALTGIGRATAVAFAKAGADVVISGRHADEGQKLAAELRSLGAEAEFVQADVRRESDVQKLIDHTISRFGRLDAALGLQDFKNGSLLATFCASYRQGTRVTASMKKHSRSDHKSTNAHRTSHGAWDRTSFQRQRRSFTGGNSYEQFK
jgi:NADPH:quinone reductase-like Zn-dependent oxidoreductase